MELSLFPRPETTSDVEELLRGMTHATGVPCPFDAHFPKSSPDACCSLEATSVVNSLTALGEKRVVARLFDGLNPTQAILVALLLRATATCLERGCEVREAESEGSSGGVVNPVRGITLPWTRLQFEEVVASIHRMADWYQKVGDLGFGVRPRF